MPKYQPLDLIGGFYTDDSLSWSAQDTVNWLPLAAEAGGTRTVTKLRTPPGLLSYSDMDPDPVRGTHNVEGRLFSVAGTTLYEIAVGGSTTNRGVIPGVSRVSMAHNQITFGNQLTIVNGDSGYVFNTVTNVLTKITDEGFDGSVQTDFLDGYMLHVDPFGRFWFHSELADALSFSTLDRYQSEASPDKIVGLKAFQSEVVVFSDTTIEFFVNVGGSEGQTFENKQIVINKGCASRHSIQRINNTLVWLGDDGAVYALNGYREQRISTVPLEQAIADNDWSQAFATVWESQGHNVYYLTFPDGRTWGYDFSSGLWARRESYELNRWRVNTLTFWQGIWIAGDFQTGELHELQWGLYRENLQPMVSERASGYSHSNQNRVQCPYLELIFDTGVGGDEVGITGDLPDGFLGDFGVYQYVASGGVGPYQYSITSGSLPEGATMDVNGLVTYTYTAGGSYSFTVTAMDSFGDTASLDDTVEITERLFIIGPLSGETYKLVNNVTDISGPTMPIPAPVAGAVSFVSGVNGLFFLHGSGLANAMVSMDGGINWVSTNRTLGRAALNMAVTYNGEYYYQESGGRSLDGVTWEDIPNYPPIVGTDDPRAFVARESDGAVVVTWRKQSDGLFRTHYTLDNGATPWVQSAISNVGGPERFAANGSTLASRTGASGGGPAYSTTFFASWSVNINLTLAHRALRLGSSWLWACSDNNWRRDPTGTAGVIVLSGGTGPASANREAYSGGATAIIKTVSSNVYGLWYSFDDGVSFTQATGTVATANPHIAAIEFIPS